MISSSWHYFSISGTNKVLQPVLGREGREERKDGGEGEVEREDARGEIKCF